MPRLVSAQSNVRAPSLADRFSQRTIGRTYGSVSSWLPLRTPSGPQFTESRLETDLLLQVAFSMRVADVITQPIISYRKGDKPRQYTPDFLIETYAEPNGQTQLYLIEVKPADKVKAFEVEGSDKIDVARIWSARYDAKFVILTEDHIRTAYWKNAVQFGRFIGQHPDADILEQLQQIVTGRPSIGDAISHLSKRTPVYLVRHAIEQAIANRRIGCNLAFDVGDETCLFPITDEFDCNASDPLLRLLKAMR